MFSKLFSQSDRIEVITDFDQIPFVGRFIGADNSFLYITDIEDSIQAISLPHVMRCRRLAADATSDLDEALSRLETQQAIDSVNVPAEDEDITTIDNDGAGAAADSTPEIEAESDGEARAEEDTRTRIGDVLPGNELYVITRKLDGPTVVGKIDLPADHRKRPRIAAEEDKDSKKDFRTFDKTEHRMRNEDPARKKEWQNDNDIWHLYPKAMGVVKSIKFKFGFLTTPEGEDLCFQGYNKADKLMPGDKVLFTPYEYPGKGTQARSVVRVRSVGAMLKKISRMDEYEEKLKIDDILDQLRAAFPDNEEVQKAIDGRLDEQDEDHGYSATRDHKPRKVSANEFKLDLKRLASRMLPDNYVSYRIQLAEMIENKKNSDDPFERNLVYDIYTSLIKNSFGRDERVRFIDEAVDYYRALGQDVKADYFERLKTANHERYERSAEESTPKQTESEAPSDVNEEDSDASADVSGSIAPEEEVKAEDLEANAIESAEEDETEEEMPSAETSPETPEAAPEESTADSSEEGSDDRLVTDKSEEA